MNFDIKQFITKDVSKYANNVKDNVLLSVCIQTYNHEKYISQCLDSILMQKTNFPFEILLGEDESKDKTREICINYAKKYPDKIRLFLHHRENVIFINGNPTGRFNFMFNLHQTRGKYIALCEGDDYWIDPFKLQKQVDSLEKNRDYGMIVTDYHKYFEETGKYQYNCFDTAKYNREVTFEKYIFDRSTIGTQTVVLRTKCMEGFFNDILNNPNINFNVGDTAFWLYVSHVSRILVLHDATAVYRIRLDSACHFTDPHKHYKFVMQGYEIPDFFLNTYNYGDDLKRKNQVKKIVSILNYAYKINNKKLFNQTFKELKITEIKPKTLLWKIGAQNKQLKNMINSILKLR